ncbi:hypothetical protein [Streptomyces asiaticus]
MGTVIAGLFGLAVAGIGVWAASSGGGGGGGGDGDSGASGSTPSVSTSSHAEAAPKPNSPAPSASTSAKPSAKTYTVVYKDRKVSLPLPSGWDVGALDLDGPTVRMYGSGEYQRLQRDAQEKGELVEPDLIYYSDTGGQLEVEDKRAAAQLDASLPTTAEQCASEAETGGFDRLAMDEWPVETGSGFCLITDEGSVVLLQITRFIGGSHAVPVEAPDRIEFTATMWQAS